MASTETTEAFVVKRLKVMYGEQPPNDPTTLALVRLSLLRLRQQGADVQGEARPRHPGAAARQGPRTEQAAQGLPNSSIKVRRPHA